MTQANAQMEEWSRRLQAVRIAPVMAALLGGSSAFFCFAMPGRVLNAVVPGNGGGGLSPTSHLIFALLIGIIIGGATWALFDRFDAPRPAKAVEDPAGPVEAVAPTLRRADAHPDAPARRPLFAQSDLGGTLELTGALPADAVVEEPAVTPEPAPPVPEPVVARRIDPKDDTIEGLLVRIEEGIGRRRRESAPAPLPVEPPSGRIDDVFRLALDELRHITNRHR